MNKRVSISIFLVIVFGYLVKLIVKLKGFKAEVNLFMGQVF